MSAKRLGRAVAGSILLALCACASLTAQERPSVVLVSIDTLRADHLRSGGARDVSTPALDEIAAQGVTFTQAVTVAPLTLPAHASLMTGTYPHFHGVRDNSGYRLPESIPTLAESFGKAGYQTAAFLGSAVLDRSFGLAAGFDHYGDQFGQAAERRGLLAERRAGAVVDEALEWLGRRGQRPVFVWIHLYDPHSPYRAPGSLARRGYKGEIEYADSQLARLFGFLKSEGLWDRSLIVAVSDHGEDLGQHGEPTHGFFVYDTVLRVPWLMKLPGGSPSGLRLDGQVSLIDVAPTIAQVVRLPVAPSAQGNGQLAAILGKSDSSGEVYAETLYPSLHFGWSPLFAIRTSRYKFVAAPQPELYDLEQDREETVNLAQRERALANRLKSRLERMRRLLQGKEPQTAQLEIDPELRARLNSLGYVTSSRGDAPAGADKGPDPKQKIGVYARIYQGMEAYTEGDLEAAQGHFQSALQRDPGVPLAHDYLGSTYLAMGRLTEAIAAYREAIRLAPTRVESASNLAYAYLQTGKLEEAAAGFELVTQLAPSDWQAWQLLGVAQLRLGRLDRAEEGFRQAAQRSPRNRQVLYNLGSVYQQQAKHLLAVEVFRRLVVQEPGDAEAWNSLATSYEASGLVDQAEQAYQQAIRSDPQYAEAFYNYANLFARRQDLARSEALYRQAIEADPSFALAYRNLAAVLELQGKKGEAAEYRQKFESLSSP